MSFKDLIFEKNGKLNEDIEMSLHMHNNGVILSFDSENTVWHNDDSCMEFNGQTLKKQIVEKHLGVSMRNEEPFVHPDFQEGLD